MSIRRKQSCFVKQEKKGGREGERELSLLPHMDDLIIRRAGSRASANLSTICFSLSNNPSRNGNPQGLF